MKKLIIIWRLIRAKDYLVATTKDRENYRTHGSAPNHALYIICQEVLKEINKGDDFTEFS